MSSGHPSGDPSPPPERGAAEGEAADAGSGPDLVAFVRSRGGPLVEALARHCAPAARHAEATGTYAYAAAAELGFERARAELVRELGRLHAAGMIYVAPALAARPAADLSEAERAELERHHEAGYRLARSAGLPDEVCEWILRVRERFDGKGPDGLAHDAIPLESRLVRAAAQLHEALAEPLPGSEASPPAHRRHGIEAIRRRAGAELDPAAVEALAGVLERLPDSGA